MDFVYVNYFTKFAKYFEPIYGYQPSEDTTVVKQYGPVRSK